MSVFKRSWRLSIEVNNQKKVFQEIENSDISLKIDFQADTKGRNCVFAEGSVTIYGLNSDDMLFLASSATINSSKNGLMKRNTLQLEVGYNGNLANILAGNIIQVDCDLANADRRITLKVQSAVGNNLSNKNIAISMRGDVDFQKICETAAEENGLRAKIDKKITPIIQKGYSFVGTPFQMLDDLRKSFKDLCFRVLPDGKTLEIAPLESPTAADKTKLSEKTGLVGVPVPIQTGLQITSLLNTNFKAGGVITLDSKVASQFNGEWIITDLTHRGGNQSSQWLSIMKCRKL